MAEPTRVHLTFLLDSGDVPTIAAARQRWDPVMARGVPPHVTLVYPEEFTDEQRLVERAEHAASAVGPFAMQSHAVVAHGEDPSGVLVTVSDPTESWCELRRHILQPPFEPKDGKPHITIVHPRTSQQGPEAWSELQGSDVTAAFTVREFCLTSTGVDAGMRVRQRFALTSQ